MSTNPVSPSSGGTSALSSLLGALAKSNAVISLGIEVAGVLTPIVKGLISEIKLISAGQQNVSYQVVLQTDESDLQQVITLSDDDLAAINAELVRLGKAPLPVPPAPANSPSA